MPKLLTIIITTAALALLMAVTAYAAPADIPDTGNPVSVDITAPYDVPTTEQLADALRYDMVPYAADYLAAAERYGLNVYFLCAKDALESGWGRYRAAPNNFGGWTDDTGKYMEFESVHAYIDYTARNLKDMYLTDTGRYHTGYTLADVGYYYNGSDEWVEAVGGIWGALERRVADVSI